jgi:hypothetical protein
MSKSVIQSLSHPVPLVSSIHNKQLFLGDPNKQMTPDRVGVLGRRWQSTPDRTGIFSGGTQMTPDLTRWTHLWSRIYTRRVLGYVHCRNISVQQFNYFWWESEPNYCLWEWQDVVFFFWGDGGGGGGPFTLSPCDTPSFVPSLFVYYESIKRELKIRPIYIWAGAKLCLLLALFNPVILKG